VLFDDCMHEYSKVSRNFFRDRLTHYKRLVNLNLFHFKCSRDSGFHQAQNDFTWIQKQHADIAFLQETYSTPEVVENWRFQWKGKMDYSHGANHSKGMFSF